MGLRTDIINILRSADATQTDFRLFGHRINGSDYRHIAQSIQYNQIQIVQSGTMRSTNAAYERAYNSFTIGSNPSPNLIVHEATHAINDWHARVLEGWRDEALAYVAQMIYVCRQNPQIQRAALSDLMLHRTAQLARSCSEIADACNMTTVGYATIVAATLGAGQTPSSQLLNDYRNALQTDPQVLNSGTRRHYNHIHHFDISPQDLNAIQGQILRN